tara:strand:- start:4481 stop:4675 length:195 start_codon:yes stop_codon:yes gene_type:complete
MSEEVLKHLSGKIQEEIVVMKEDLAMGKAKDFGIYQHSCGVIRGLLVANNLIIELAERMETEDE